MRKSQLPAELSHLIDLYPPAKGLTYSKSQLLKLYLTHTQNPDKQIVESLKKKPVRTMSGVTPVTVLTKPYPCPGECIFCPVDVRMPKSYIATEPGAQRAAQNGFDPYLQVYNRLKAYQEIGHPISKVELIVLGGTWSVYPEDYQLWFITRCFQAMNDFGDKFDNRPQVQQVDLSAKLDLNLTYNQHIAKKTNYAKQNQNEVGNWNDLIKQQELNVNGSCRCVGLVLETRPDYTTKAEVIKLRRFGATKIQVGIQSLSDEVLKLNKRGHTVQETRQAISLLRQAGFKIHAHWMPNLYGSTPKKDIKDYQQLFLDPDICPDELKVYPCSLIPNTELETEYKNGNWHPYTQAELTKVLTFVLTHTPEYCRLSRIIRDIPGQEIVTGNKTTNFRQLLEKTISSEKMKDIRSREVKNKKIKPKELILDDQTYQTSDTEEHFLQFITKDRRIAAFLRLSLPHNINNCIEELENSAIIREVHVYGQSETVGNKDKQTTQHQGLGKKLIAEAINLAKHKKYPSIAVISAIGTREYYQQLCFRLKDLYQHYSLEGSTSKA